MANDKTYVAPTLKVEGTLHDLTLTPKFTTHKPDGFSFNGVALTT